MGTSTHFNLDILQHGLLVRVSVYGLGVFENTSKWEEFGIRSDDVDSSRNKASRRTFFPTINKSLQSWGIMCRQATSKYCRSLESLEALMASTSWRFLFFDGYDLFTTRMEELKTKLAEIKQEFRDSYEYLFDDDMTYYKDQGRKAWDKLAEKYGQGVQVTVWGKVYADKESFAEFISQSIMAQAPTPDQFDKAVSTEHFTSVAVFDGSMNAQALQATHNKKIDLDIKEREQGINAKYQAILDVERERAREQLSEVMSPVDEAMGLLLSDLLDGVNGLLKKNGNFKGRAKDSGKRFVEIYNTLGGALLNNEELDKLMASLSARMEETPTQEQRETWSSSVVGTLEGIKAQVNREKKEITSKTRSRSGRLRA